EDEVAILAFDFDLLYATIFFFLSIHGSCSQEPLPLFTFNAFNTVSALQKFPEWKKPQAAASHSYSSFH
ncbi:MAG TPA: hypothetical protein PK492_12170, partial [Chitinophagaceae bacterium]|nr:hypothetical protein [Chitinophagaceae bacterium]